LRSFWLVCVLKRGETKGVPIQVFFIKVFRNNSLVILMQEQCPKGECVLLQKDHRLMMEALEVGQFFTDKTWDENRFIIRTPQF
jgi:hypothetical protein